jgi:hypothetical protein
MARSTRNYRKNREKVNARARAHYQLNREQLLPKMRANYFRRKCQRAGVACVETKP